MIFRSPDSFAVVVINFLQCFHHSESVSVSIMNSVDMPQHQGKGHLALLGLLMWHCLSSPEDSNQELYKVETATLQKVEDLQT